jgi:gliding motility-associated-like protein
VLLNSVSVCDGNTVTLTVQNPNAGYTYNWYAAATGGAILGSGISFTTPPVTANTVYYVEVVSNGCNSPRTGVDVIVTTITAPVVSAVTACQGNTAILTVQNLQAGYTYNWYNVSTGGTIAGTGISFTTTAVTASTTWYVEAVTGSCSGLRVPVLVSMYASLISPVVTVGTITASTVTFNWQTVAGAAGYEVSVNGGPYITPSSGSTGTTHLVSGLTPSQTVTIDVVALSAVTGCPNSPAGHAEAKTELGGFYVPTAFTPNGDTHNDVMRPILPTSAVLEYFTIYNRWGGKVFTTSTKGDGWNGKWRGKDQPAGIYVWICRYQYMGSSFDEKGSFLLLH